MSLPTLTVLSVVVTYHPEPAQLRTLLHSLAAQTTAVLIVDNSPAADDTVDAVMRDLPTAASASIRLERMGSNQGIGAALNFGIETAVREGFDFVQLSDQDSLPEPDMTSQLLGVAANLEEAGVRVGCVCPAYFDRNTGQCFSFQVQEPGRLFYGTRPCDAADPWVEMITGITSGSLHPCGAFKEIGLMRSDWFIDYVDTEWFHRARAQGYRIFGTSRAILNHHLGDSSFRVWYGRWRNFNGYSPERLYYRFRNFVLLLKLRYVPMRWKIRAGWYWLGNLYAYCLFSPNRAKNLRSIVRGVFHGCRNLAGAADAPSHANDNPPRLTSC